MNLDAVITQLRTYCPTLANRVAGAADFVTGLESTVNLALPSAFVYPLGYSTAPNQLWNGLTQTVTERIAVVVEFDNTVNGVGDRRGQTGANQVEAMLYALHKALLNWQIDPTRDQRGIYFDGGELLDFDRARLFFEYRYAVDAVITDNDGFIPTGEPLTDINATVEGLLIDQATGTIIVNTPTIGVDIPFPD